MDNITLIFDRDDDCTEQGKATLSYPYGNYNDFTVWFDNEEREKFTLSAYKGDGTTVYEVFADSDEIAHGFVGANGVFVFADVNDNLTRESPVSPFIAAAMVIYALDRGEQ